MEETMNVMAAEEVLNEVVKHNAGFDLKSAGYGAAGVIALELMAKFIIIPGFKKLGNKLMNVKYKKIDENEEVAEEEDYSEV